MISVVIPSYNRRERMSQLLTDLYQQDCENMEIIVVDDCSPDDTVQEIRANFPQVRLLINSENGGPCVSRNRGIEAAKGDIIVGFDSDVRVPDKELLTRVATFFEQNSHTSGLAFRIFEPDGLTDDAPRWWHPVPLKENSQSKFVTDYFSGTAYAFRKKDMQAAGLYPEFLYMHYEEVLLAFRILDQGGRILYNPDFTACHHESKVSSRSYVQKYYKPRNQILLSHNCLPVKKGFTYLLPRISYQMYKSITGLYFPTYLKAVWDGLRISLKNHHNRSPLSQLTISQLVAWGRL